ncbi:MAG TPA: HAD family hydrolase [Candidatus Paceibacterota bacterium]
MAIRAVVLDFDNCVALDERTRKGSEDIKNDAWFSVFSEYEHNALDAVLEESKDRFAGGKGDRMDIAREVLLHFGFTGDLEKEVNARCERFNTVIQEDIKKIPISENWHYALAELAKRLPLYLNTGTPEITVRESLDALGLAKYFEAIYGRPGTKVENLNTICKRENVLPQEVLFVDDQQSSFEAAEQEGVRFAGIHTARNTAWHTGTHPFPIIRSLKELLDMLG